MTGRSAARFAGAVILGLVGLGVGLSVEDAGVAHGYETWIVLGPSLFGVITGLLLAPYTFRPLLRWSVDSISATPARTLIAGTLGLIVGLIVSALALLAFSVAALPAPWDNITPALVTVVVASLGLLVGLAKGSELFQVVGQSYRGLSEEVLTPQQRSGDGRVILVDTSAIIDGRIAEVSQTGFVDGRLLIPNFVLDELQYVADSSDPLRRNRGRRGLDVLNRLRKDQHIDVQIVNLEVPGENGVDSKLVTLAKSSNYTLLTTDFNLNKVAELQGVRVLNINDLANSLKPSVLPGEDMPLHITQEGKEEGQGVGFLDDGTMVVVEGGRRYMNSQLPVVVTRVLQTSAGRIIFAHLK